LHHKHNKTNIYICKSYDYILKYVRLPFYNFGIV
jgi:hypothetical protein